jgi:hypothetical protein
VVLTPGQQKALFVLVVVALAALGYFLVVPALRHSPGTSQAGSSPTPAASAAGPAGPATSAPPPTVTASPATAGGTGGVNIYSWLPFTQQDLADAASVAVRFSVDYNTYSYTESPKAYTDAMGGLITSQLATTLQAAYATPGVARLRTGERQVSTGTAAIGSLRAFGPSSMTFVVDTTQHLVTSVKTSNASAQYAVTLTGSGASWQVSDIEPSNAGNF